MSAGEMHAVAADEPDAKTISDWLQAVQDDHPEERDEER